MSTTTAHARQVIAGNVRAVLGRNRSTQTDLASVLGKSQAAISRRLNGELPFDTDELFAIAEHYKVPMAELLRIDQTSPGIHGPYPVEQPRLFDLAA